MFFNTTSLNIRKVRTHDTAPHVNGTTVLGELEEIVFVILVDPPWHTVPPSPAALHYFVRTRIDQIRVAKYVVCPNQRVSGVPPITCQKKLTACG
jgi:hypothetical protein